MARACFAGVSALLAAVLSSAAAAADYRAALALEWNGRYVTGELDGCLYGQDCRHRFDRGDVVVSILIKDAGDREVRVRIDGWAT
jgi:opacity protein-like surface antigen